MGSRLMQCITHHSCHLACGHHARPWFSKRVSHCLASGGALSAVTAGVEAEGAAGIGAVKRAVPQAEYVQIKVAAAALAARALWFTPARAADADGVDLEPRNPQHALGAASQGSPEGASVPGAPARGEARPAATPLVRPCLGPQMLHITAQTYLAASQAARRRKRKLTTGRSAAHAIGKHRHCPQAPSCTICFAQKFCGRPCRRQRTQTRGNPRPAPPSVPDPHARPARRPRLAPCLVARRWAWRARRRSGRDCQGRA